MNEAQNLVSLIRKALVRMDFEFNHLPDFGNKNVSSLLNEDYSLRRQSLLLAIEVIEKVDMSQGGFTKEICQQLPLADYSFVVSLIDNELTIINKNLISTTMRILSQKGADNEVEPTLKDLNSHYWPLVDSKCAFVEAYNTHCLR